MDRTGILVIGVCSALLVLWYIAYLPRMSQMQEERRRQAARNEQAQAQPPPQTEPADDPETPPDDPTTPDGDRAEDAPPSPAPTPTEDDGAELLPPTAAQERTLNVRGDADPLFLQADDRMVVRLDPARAGISRITLLEYQKMTGDGHVELGQGVVPYLSLVYGERMLRGSSVRVVESSGRHAVFERLYGDPSVTLTETWRLVPDRPYLIEYTVDIANTGDADLHLSQFAVACGSMTPEETPGVGKAGTAGIVELAAAAKAPDERRPDSFPPKKIGKLSASDRRDLAVSPASWVAVHNKYFVLHCEPSEGAFRGCKPGQTATAEEEDEAAAPVFAVATLPRQTLSPGSSQTLSFRGYGGPKKFEIMKSMGNGLERLMRLDLFLFFHPRWMEYVTSGILRALVALNSFFNSQWGYGYAIIVITFVIKMLFWPLTHTSTVSMHRMQAIQPQLKELKEQYKDQPQKMQQKTMELYRQHKVNPLGGCLPILLQIPVFFALFNTFRSAIELRQASFLWVQDLSLPDTLPFTPFGFPLRPLAIFMGATMLIQQMTTPTSGDPQQKKMMMFMTAFFVFIFYTMPAGLTLYWSVNQVLTSVQNIISRRLHTMPNAQPAETGG